MYTSLITFNVGMGYSTSILDVVLKNTSNLGISTWLSINNLGMGQFSLNAGLPDNFRGWMSIYPHGNPNYILATTSINPQINEYVDIKSSTILSGSGGTAFINNILDLANGVEIGISLRKLFQAVGAAIAGVSSGAGTGTETFYGIGMTAPVRIVAHDDSLGNRVIDLF